MIVWKKRQVHCKNAKPFRIRPHPGQPMGGPAAWKALHEQALAGKVTLEWLNQQFTLMIPRYGCACLKEWRAILAATPFRPADQFAWSVEVHNAVNAKLVPPKPQITVEQARAVWAPGG